jgi:hypothetical protein
MNLPNYFLADLPPEAVLTPSLLTEACVALKRNRETYLESRSTNQIIQVIAEAAAGWRRPQSRFRELALAQGPAQLGFGRATLARGLDLFFESITEANLQAWIKQDLGAVRRLDELGSGAGDAQDNRVALAVGPEFLVQVAAGNLPNPTLVSLMLGLLTRAAQLVKCARGTALLPRLFAHSIYEIDPKLAACVEVAEWRGGDEVLEAAVLAEADCVTATGSDETLAAIRNRLPPHVRFLGYGHKVSFGFVAADVLTAFNAPRVIRRAAEDVVAWDQLGCLSPHIFYVACGGGWTPEQFAEALAEELARREESEPRGVVNAAVAATIAARRSIYQVRAAHSPDTRLWQSPASTAWTVVLESGSIFPVSCLHRFIYVRPVATLVEALQHADPVRRHISTVGLAVVEPAWGEAATKLARWGARRVCPLGRMQQPPLGWRHDGRPALGDLVKWTEVES